jgi:hypothetical protein
MLAKIRFLNLKKIAIFIGLILAIGIWILNESAETRSYSKFIKREYRGRVYDIQFRPNRAGCPDALVGDKWIQFVMEEQKIFKSLKIGDSLVKVKGDDKIRIYKRDIFNNLKVNVY